MFSFSKRAIGNIIVLILALTMVACGKDPDFMPRDAPVQRAQPTNLDRFEYVAMPQSLSLGNVTFQALTTNNGEIYGATYAQNAESEDLTLRNLVKIDGDANVVQLSPYKLPSVNNDDGEEQILKTKLIGMAVLDNEKLALLSLVRQDENDSSISLYCTQLLDIDGYVLDTVIFSKDEIDDVLVDVAPYGNGVALLGETTVYTLNDEAKLTNSYPLPATEELGEPVAGKQFIRTTGPNLLVLMQDGSVQKMADSGAFSQENIIIPFDAKLIINQSTDKIHYVDGIDIVGKTGAGTSTLLVLPNVGINPLNIAIIGETPDTQESSAYYGVQVVNGQYEMFIVRMAKIPWQDRTIEVNIGTLDATPDLVEILIEKNIPLSGLHYNIIEYDNLDGLAEAAKSGKVDVVIMQNLPFKKLATDGALRDLSDMMSGDADFSENKYSDSLLGLWKINGGIREIADGFTIHSLAGLKTRLGEAATWTLADVENVATKLSSKVYFSDDYVTPEQAWDALVTIYGNLMTQEQEPDVPTWSERVEAVAKLFDNSDKQSKLDTSSLAGVVANMRDNKQMLCTVNIDSVEAYNVYSSYFTDLFNIIGYPNEDGNTGHLVTFLHPIAIANGSEHVDEAWDFVKDWLNFYSNEGLPTRTWQLNEYATAAPDTPQETPVDDADTDSTETDEEAAEPQPIDEEYTARLAAMGANVEDVTPLTQEKVNELRRIINSCMYVYDTSNELYGLYGQDADAGEQ